MGMPFAQKISPGATFGDFDRVRQFERVANTRRRRVHRRVAYAVLNIC